MKLLTETGGAQGGEGDEVPECEGDEVRDCEVMKSGTVRENAQAEVGG